MFDAQFASTDEDFKFCQDLVRGEPDSYQHSKHAADYRAVQRRAESKGKGKDKAKGKDKGKEQPAVGSTGQPAVGGKGQLVRDRGLALRP